MQIKTTHRLRFTQPGGRVFISAGPGTPLEDAPDWIALDPWFAMNVKAKRLAVVSQAGPSCPDPAPAPEAIVPVALPPSPTVDVSLAGLNPGVAQGESQESETQAALDTLFDSPPESPTEGLAPTEPAEAETAPTEPPARPPAVRGSRRRAASRRTKVTTADVSTEPD